jgi:hypothetical protein
LRNPRFDRHPEGIGSRRLDALEKHSCKKQAVWIAADFEITPSADVRTAAVGPDD